MGKSTWGLSNAAQKWGAQRLKGHKYYKVSMFLSLFFLIKMAILLIYLLLGLSY